MMFYLNWGNKRKIDDVLTSHVWFGDEMFNQRKLENKEELMRYAYGYNESRIQHEHTTDLLTVYLDQLSDIIKELDEGIKNRPRPRRNRQRPTQ